jgi:hypothetical protein
MLTIILLEIQSYSLGNKIYASNSGSSSIPVTSEDNKGRKPVTRSFSRRTAAAIAAVSFTAFIAFLATKKRRDHPSPLYR